MEVSVNRALTVNVFVNRADYIYFSQYTVSIMTNKNCDIRTRVTKMQFEQISSEAYTKGFVTVAAYIRDLALNNRKFLEAKIVETNRLVRKMSKHLEDGK